MYLFKNNIYTFIPRSINKAVYGAGFARSQEDYDKAVKTLFESLDKVSTMKIHSPWVGTTRPTNQVKECCYHYINVKLLFDVLDNHVRPKEVAKS